MRGEEKYEEARGRESEREGRQRKGMGNYEKREREEKNRGKEGEGVKEQNSEE